MNNNNTNQKPNKNKFKKSITIIILIIFLALIVSLFFFWRYNNSTKINEATYKIALGENKTPGKPQLPGTFNNETITKYGGAVVNIGQQTTVISGSFEIGNKIVRYTVEINNHDFSKPSVGSVASIHSLMNGKNISIVQKDRNFVPGWEKLLSGVLPFVLMVGLGFFIFSRMSKTSGGMGSPFSMGKNRAKQITSTVRFSDIAGIEEEKLELTELVDYLKNSEKYIKKGARIPRGVLMEGPPGTGKTLLAKAVAGEADVPFLSISGSEFEEMFVGVGASRIREMFNLAKKNSPSIIFIDEIDAVGRKRGSSIGAGTNEQTLNQLLVEMDGFGTDSSVIIIAATNRVDVLDLALLRPGRFDRQIQIPLPDVNAREAILRLHARNKKMAKNIKFRRIAERTPGFSGAQLENVLNESIILAIREKRDIVNIYDIDEAIDRVVAGPAKKSRVMRMMDKKIVSYHEAGHALIGLKVENASQVQKVTIIPRGNAGGYTIMTPKEEIAFHSKRQLFAMIKGFLGGRASEEFIFGKDFVTTGAHDDLEKATSIVRKMITEYGMSSLGLNQFENSRQQALGIPSKISETLSTRIDEESNRILNECYVDALKIIKSNSKLLELLSESLNILETLTAEQIEYIDANGKLPEEVIKAKKEKAEYDKKEKKGFIFKVKPNDIFNSFSAEEKESSKKDSKKKKESKINKKKVDLVKDKTTKKLVKKSTIKEKAKIKKTIKIDKSEKISDKNKDKKDNDEK